MIRTQVRVRGSANAAFAEVERRLAVRIERALWAVGNFLFEECLKLMPKDTGTLERASGVRQEGSGLGTRIVVGFGRYGHVEILFSPKEGEIVRREPSEYVVYLHEIPPDIHKHDAPEQYQFLADPLLTMREEMRQVFNQAFYQAV